MNVGPPRSEADWERFTRIEGEAFGTTPEATERYIATVRDAAIARFAYAGDTLIGGALAFPCGQLFGGRSVPAGSVASVCVAPEHRGTGAGRAIMWSLAQAMDQAGLAVSSLWPSSIPFYRRLGWELAGPSTAFRVPAAAFGHLRGAGEAVRDPGLGEVPALRAAATAGRTGPLERPEWWWNWRLPAPGHGRFHIGWREGERLTGFVAYRQDAPKDRPWGFDVVVTDFWAITSDALDGLLRLLSTEAPLSPDIRFGYGVLPDDTLVRFRAGAGELTPYDQNRWMTRVLDPVGAVTASGWPAVSGRVEIEVAGIGQAPARMAVAFAGGRAEVSPSDAPRVRMAAGAFSAWFAGSLPATSASTLGMASGPAEDLAFMDLLVADRRPWLPDTY